MLERLRRLRRLIEDQLWSREPLQPAPLAWARSTLQLGVMIARGVSRDQLLLRAHSLSFLTVFSLVPLLALSVSIVELFGVSEDLTRILLEQVAAGTPEAVDQILPYVRKLEFGALGTLGGVVLAGTTVLMIGNIEQALNAIWGVRRQRVWVRRIPDYLAVLIVAPLALAVAVSLRTTFESQWIIQRLLDSPMFSDLYGFGLRQAPTLLVVAALTFVYWFLPNTEVRFRSALLGGVVGGVLFSLAQLVYLGFNVGAARYGAIFGALAFLPLLVVWIYFEWVITLFGAEVAFAHQQLPLYRREVRVAHVGQGAREAVGLALALEVARAFRDGRAPLAADALSERLDVPVRLVRDVAGRLIDARVLAEASPEGRGPGLLLARPAELISVAALLRALRGPREAPIGLPDVAKVVRETFTALDEQAASGAVERTLASLIASLDQVVDPPGPAQ